jgi:hypothetical protein
VTVHAKSARGDLMNTDPAVWGSDPGPVESWPLYRLNAYIGGLSSPSKMPGYSFSLPTDDCGVGSALRSVPGSTCEHCYAHYRGRYGFPNVVAALRRRADRLELPLWVPVMAELLNRRRYRKRNPIDVHRWHDAGDIRNRAHLEAIVAVAELTPDVRHWIPTRETRTVMEWIKAGGRPPANLTIRVSALMIGGFVPTFPRLPAGVTVTVSSVSRTPDDYPDAHHCPAPSQGNACGDCRACWDPAVAHVTYHLH